MIKIGNDVIRKQENFWSNCLFHPTDAVEDPWGKRILDRMAEDKAIQTVRIYTMFEDIVYLDEEGGLQFDFRVSDLRLDYLVGQGYELLLAYAGMPDCIAASTANKTSVSKNKTRYKGKMFNTSPPKENALWEEICYRYTLHNVERYGIERVSRWRCQCFNEPDIPFFFLSELPADRIRERVEAYCGMYTAFQRGIRRVSERIPVGGPALAHRRDFLGAWLDYVKDHGLKLDFISLHNYGTSPAQMQLGAKVTVENNMEKHRAYLETVEAHGFAHLPLIIDEWGFASGGFMNMEECPGLMRRETEEFSAYYGKLIHGFLKMGKPIGGMFICLSGQHEMIRDFTGFRNFFTLNFIAKPIYNAHILASRLHEGLLEGETDRKDLAVIPTRNDRGGYAVLLAYASEYFDEAIPAVTESLEFREDLTGRKVTLWAIDREHTNPYRLFEKMGVEDPDQEQLRSLREEGKLKPISEAVCQGNKLPPMTFTANGLYLIEVE